ncbi:YaaC family protein [Streptomyces violascens]|uniref:YaaC family protein n=1 Tax=Streptomyces violascens TaxID=67381 RepID=UPI003661972F
MDTRSALWIGLRRRRTSLLDRSLLKDSSSRRRTFAAALQQFEEQMTAANVVSAATRPINLYYTLVQAGLAISAAHTPGQFSFDKHGLTVADMGSSVPAVCIRRHGHGAFQVVAAATASPQIAGTVTLGSLWMSIPELSEDVPLEGVPYRPALTVIPHRFHSRSGYVQGALGTLEAQLHAQLCANGKMPVEAERAEWLAHVRVNYPTLRDASLPTDVGETFREVRPGRFTVDITCPAADTTEQAQFLDTLAPLYRFEAHRWARPSVEAASEPPSPLMSWWLLLYSFSMLARYQPRMWLEALDIDKSPNAAALEHALDEALEVLPHLVLEGLDQHPLLLRAPL